MIKQGEARLPRYLAIIEEENGVFGAWFPDAPGCTAMGTTEEELIANAREALSEWAADVLTAEGSLPEPRLTPPQ